MNASDFIQDNGFEIYQALSTLFLDSLWVLNFGVEIFVHYEEFQGLHISSFHVFLCLNTCISNDWQGMFIYGMNFFFPLSFQGLSYSLVMLRCYNFLYLITVAMWLWDTKVFIAFLYVCCLCHDGNRGLLCQLTTFSLLPPDFSSPNDLTISSL